MTPARLRECLSILGWTQRGLAELLLCNNRVVRRWASGDGTVPERVAAWIERLAAYHARHPPPAQWKTRGLTVAPAPSDQPIR